MFPKRLREARKINNLTQKRLAELLNTKKQTISNYETGYSSPSQEMLIDIADLLNVTTDFLLGRTDQPGYTVEEETAEYIKSGKMDIEDLKDYKLAWGDKPLSEEEKEKLFKIIQAYISND